jgi:quercetin dioxygenase-like cupin family protein
MTTPLRIALALAVFSGASVAAVSLRAEKLHGMQAGEKPGHAAPAAPAAPAAGGPAATAPADTGAHIMVKPAEITWGDAPPALPPGAKVAVIEGKPSEAGPFTMRVKFPAGYKIAPHWHPADEHVTVLSGNFRMGVGEKFDEKTLKDLPPGGFAVMVKGTRHFAQAKGPTIVQVHGMGPWGLTYVNPGDDPRLAKK